MTTPNPDEIRLNSLRLLAKMIASAYLKQGCPKSKASCGNKWCAGSSSVAQTGQDNADAKGS